MIKLANLKKNNLPIFRRYNDSLIKKNYFNAINLFNRYVLPQWHIEKHITNLNELQKFKIYCSDLQILRLLTLAIQHNDCDNSKKLLSLAYNHNKQISKLYNNDELCHEEKQRISNNSIKLKISQSQRYVKNILLSGISFHDNGVVASIFEKEVSQASESERKLISMINDLSASEKFDVTIGLLEKLSVIFAQHDQLLLIKTLKLLFSDKGRKICKSHFSLLLESYLVNGDYREFWHSVDYLISEQLVDFNTKDLNFVTKFMLQSLKKKGSADRRAITSLLVDITNQVYDHMHNRKTKMLFFNTLVNFQIELAGLGLVNLTQFTGRLSLLMDLKTPNQNHLLEAVAGNTELIDHLVHGCKVFDFGLSSSVEVFKLMSNLERHDPEKFTISKKNSLHLIQTVLKYNNRGNSKNLDDLVLYYLIDYSIKNGKLSYSIFYLLMQDAKNKLNYSILQLTVELFSPGQPRTRIELLDKFHLDESEILKQNFEASHDHYGFGDISRQRMALIARKILHANNLDHIYST